MARCMEKDSRINALTDELVKSKNDLLRMMDELIQTHQAIADLRARAVPVPTPESVGAETATQTGRYQGWLAVPRTHPVAIK